MDPAVSLLRVTTLCAGVVRVVRLARLLRILRASRMVERWSQILETKLAMSFSTRTLLWWTFILLVVVHWNCCIWGLVADLFGSQHSDVLTAEMGVQEASGIGLDATCLATACFPNTTAPGEDCPNTCLAHCEITALAALSGRSYAFVFNNENWICRHRDAGDLRKSDSHHVEVRIHIVGRPRGTPPQAAVLPASCSLI